MIQSCKNSILIVRDVLYCPVDRVSAPKKYIQKMHFLLLLLLFENDKIRIFYKKPRNRLSLPQFVRQYFEPRGI